MSFMNLNTLAVSTQQLASQVRGSALRLGGAVGITDVDVVVKAGKILVNPKAATTHALHDAFGGSMLRATSNLCKTACVNGLLPAGLALEGAQAGLKTGAQLGAKLGLLFGFTGLAVGATVGAAAGLGVGYFLSQAPAEAPVGEPEATVVDAAEAAVEAG
jgi:hypothetical protein